MITSTILHLKYNKNQQNERVFKDFTNISHGCNKKNKNEDMQYRIFRSKEINLKLITMLRTNIFPSLIHS
jgi:hypothetical protein